MLIKSSLADYIRNRVETIGFGQIDRTAWNRDWFYLTVALIMVKVKTTRTRSHDNIMPLLSSFDTTINTSPRHDGSILTQSTFQNFIPSDDFLTILLQHLFYTLDDIALQSFLCRVLAIALKMLVNNTLLTSRAGFPTGFRALVATYMEIFAREERHHFLEDIIQEMEHQFLTRTHHDVLNTPNHSWSPLFSLTGQFWISSNSRHHVSRKIHLRNHRHIALGSIIHDILNLLLCIKTSIDRAIAFLAITADRSQFRIFLDFNTPALIFRQMEMHRIDLERSHQVNLLLHILYSNEMTAWIEMETTITETRIVFDITTLCHPFDSLYQRSTFHFRWQQLQEGLHTIEGSLASLSFDNHSLGSNLKAIALPIHFHRRVDNDRDISLLVAHIDLISSRSLELACQITSYRFTFLCIVGNTKAGRQNKFSTLLGEFDWCWNHIDFCSQRTHRIHPQVNHEGERWK